MKIINQTVDGLNCCYEILISQQDFTEKLTSKMTQLSSTVKIPGFRPGKIPEKIFNARYKQAATSEILSELAEKGCELILKNQEIKPAEQVKLVDIEHKEESDVRIKYEFESLPKIDDLDFKSMINIKKPTADVKKQDIQNFLEIIAKNNTRKTLLKTDRASNKKDIVDIECKEILLNEAKNKDQSAKIANTNITLILDEEEDDFSKNIIGMKIDELKKFTAKIPTIHFGDQFAGKEAKFTVILTNIYTLDVPIIDDEYSKINGFKSLENMRDCCSLIERYCNI